VGARRRGSQAFARRVPARAAAAEARAWHARPVQLVRARALPRARHVRDGRVGARGAGEAAGGARRGGVRRDWRPSGRDPCSWPRGVLAAEPAVPAPRAGVPSPPRSPFRAVSPTRRGIPSPLRATRTLPSGSSAAKLARPLCATNGNGPAR
jgi:hypothetical protein